MKNKINRFLALSSASLLGTLGLLATAPSAKALTFVLDFIEDGQGSTGILASPNQNEDVTVDLGGNIVNDFDITAYGFSDTEEDFDLFTTNILSQVETHYGAIGLSNPSSLNFEIGNIGTAPVNGDSEYYYMQIGSYEGYDSNTDITENGGEITSTGTIGRALLGIARNSVGESNPFNQPSEQFNDHAIGSVFTDHIDSIFDPVVSSGSETLENAVNIIAATLSHEIGHTLNLEHVYKQDSVTPNNLPPIMGTGALDTTGNDLIGEMEFSTFAYGEAVSSGSSNQSGGIFSTDGMFINPLGEDIPLENIPDDSPTVNNTALLQSAVEGTAAVPFEFSPGMGLFLVGGTWGVASLRKKSRSAKKG